MNTAGAPGFAGASIGGPRPSYVLRGRFALNSEKIHRPAEPVEPGAGAFLTNLGVRSDAPGRLVLDLGPAHLRSLGIAHGGVVATLLDSVMGWNASRSAPADHYVVTAQLNVNFIRPAWEGESLRAVSELRHHGRMTAVAQGEVRTAGGALVATGSATFVYVKHTDRTRANPDRLDPGPAAAPDTPPSP